MAPSGFRSDDLRMRCDRQFRVAVDAFPAMQFADPAAQRVANVARAQSTPVRGMPTDIRFGSTRVESAAAAPSVAVRTFAPVEGPVRARVVWIHGGGYVTGGASDDDGLCVRLVRELGAAVVSVDYRLAPEHPFPAAFDDCYAVARSVVDSRSGGPVVLAGGSAGAGLAAAVAMRFRDEERAGVLGQALLFPCLDPACGSRSMRELSDAPVFDADDARHCWAHYLGDDHRRPSAYQSVLHADDYTGLPPAYVAAAGLDCLHDDAQTYAERLRSARVAVEFHSFDGVPHGFTGIVPKADASRRAVADLIAATERFTADEQMTQTGSIE